ncbi:MAG: GNAT family N-acetyltransferase [Bdellovibrionota bacterium]
MIKTERLNLRIPGAHDIPDILQFYQANKAHLAPWDPVTPPGFYTADYWQEKVAQAQAEYQQKQSLRLLLRLMDDQTLIGMVHVTQIERGPFQNCRVGYKLAQTHQGSGYMFEALQSVIRYVFQTLHLHRIEANYIPSNARSGKLLERLGFTKHGIAPQYLHIAGKWQDHMLTSLLNPGLDAIQN